MSSKLGIGFALLAALTAPVIGTGILVVNVEEGGPDGHHWTIPIPLILVRPLATLLPAEKSRIHCPELAEYHEMALRVVRELAAAPDADFVRVEEAGETVLIRKANGRFEIHVDKSAEQALVRLPAAAVEEVLASYDDEAFHLKDLVSASRHLSRGDVVRVVSREERVRIAIW
jgi:hypothetical protein